MNLVLKVEIPNLDSTIFVGTYVHFSHLGYGCFAASRTWNEGGNLRTCALAETPGVHHTKQCHPSTKRNRENKRPIFLSFFCCEIFVKLASCITGPCWLLNILCPKFPPSIVLGLSGIIPATCTIRQKGAAIFTPLMFWARALSARCPNMWLTWSSGTYNNIHMLLYVLLYVYSVCVYIYTYTYKYMHTRLYVYIYMHIYSFPYIFPKKQIQANSPAALPPDLISQGREALPSLWPWYNQAGRDGPNGNVKTRKSPKESEARLSVGLGFD